MAMINPPAESNKVALVTGAARRIGACIVETLHARGLHVMIHCHQSREIADELAEKLNVVRAGSASVVCADLGDEQAIEQLSKQVTDKQGHLDVLVHNASRFYPTPAGTMTQQNWDELINSNARGALFLTQALTPLLRAAKGNIVSIVDIHIDRPMKSHTIYSMAKSALQTMTRSLAKELAPEIRVNGVAPGAILWPENGMSDEARQTILERVALQRSGNPEDIAGAVGF